MCNPPSLNEVNASTSEDMTYHLRVSRQTAEQRALEMINLKWTLKQANKQRPSGCTESWLDIPDHVENASVGTQMVGIPYCTGSGNGLEYLYGGNKCSGSFLEAVNSGKIAGNVGGAVCEHSVGLDCSGYASSVYKLPYNYFSTQLVNAGINLGACANYGDLNAVLDKMDLIVQMDTFKHIFIFIEQKTENGIKYIYFYNCTQKYGYTVDGDPGPHNKAMKGKIDKDALDAMKGNLTIHKMWNCEYVYTYYNSKQHKRTRSCGVCDTTTSYLPHKYSSYSSYNGSYHAKTCSFCSDTVKEAHKYSSSTGPCTVCGYNGPRPGIITSKFKDLSGQNASLTE